MHGVAGLHEMRLVQLIGIGSVLVFGAAHLSLSLAWQMMPGSLHRVAARVAVVTLAAGFLVGIAIFFSWRALEAFLLRGWSCLKAGILLAISAASLFGLLVRRGHAMPNWGATGHSGRYRRPAGRTCITAHVRPSRCRSLVGLAPRRSHRFDRSRDASCLGGQLRANSRVTFNCCSTKLSLIDLFRQGWLATWAARCAYRRADPASSFCCRLLLKGGWNSKRGRLEPGLTIDVRSEKGRRLRLL